MGAYASSVADETVKQNRVDFFVNGKPYTVDTATNGKIGPKTLLVDFLRETARLTGTKFTCREGGCGACAVTVKFKDPASKRPVICSVNACLIPLLVVDGWDITTVEGLGNKVNGYHKIQQEVVKFNATQCGFCTPGMIMNFHSLKQSKSALKMEDVEDAFDGNICRCTGYRPILDCFKSMTSNVSEELKRKNLDNAIQNDGCGCSSQGKCCKQGNSETATNDEFNTFDKLQELSMEVDDDVDIVEEAEDAIKEIIGEDSEPIDDLSLTDSEKSGPYEKLYLQLTAGESWIRATSLKTLFEAIGHFTSSGADYRLVAGNTGTGVFKHDGPYKGYIDINTVPQLKRVITSNKRIEVGAGTSLNRAIALFQKSSGLDGFFYMKQLGKHIKRVANNPVRNAGTLAGNLMMKHQHNDFPSDIFMLLDCIKAKLFIASSPTVAREYSMGDFIKLDMRGKVVISVRFPPYKGGMYFFRSFKITRRYQNAHAYVNAAFLLKVDTRKSYTVLERPSITYGGINAKFSHAGATEAFLTGKMLNAKTIQGAMGALGKEIQPAADPLDADPKYRRTLTQTLLYKVILGIMGDNVKEPLKSGGTDINRFLMQGKQDFDTDKSMWPIYQPMNKLEAQYQASGEAEYVFDMEQKNGELCAAYVVTTVANATIQSIDASEALMMPGVVRLITAKDVPGANNGAIYYVEAEPLFTSDKVTHAGQPVGLILAESMAIAWEAASKVSIKYKDVKKPVLTLQDSLNRARESGRFSECILQTKKTPANGEEVTDTQSIKGELYMGSQYHFHMENQSCYCVPREDGMDVYATSQFPHQVQATIAAVLGIPSNTINVIVRRLGGGFGAKITKHTPVAAACAVAAGVMNRPVRLVCDLETNMKVVGKRLPYLSKYEVSFQSDGKISSLKCDYFCDPGYVSNENTQLFAMGNFQNCYRTAGWEVTGGKANTDTHPNTFCRTPGAPQAIAVTETIMEHIAFELKMDPLQVRMNNFFEAGDPSLVDPEEKVLENAMPSLIPELQASSEYDARKAFVENFNANNRWRKRGLSIVPMRYPNHYPDVFLRYPVYISVYAADGTVNVSHGGIEMGQGINTKCAQVVAKELNIPVDKVKIVPTNTLLSPNSGLTGGAIVSELVCHAALLCCQQLLAKMEPAKQALKDPTWEEICGECRKQHILLTAHHQDKLDSVKPYDIWGVTLTEVELDVLTGEFKIVRVDLLEDVGKSINPYVDLGQIEGAFVFGIGYWMSEKITRDKNTGELLSCNTWNYKVPLPRDIPEDFRVTIARNRENPFGVLGSKASGEAPLCMAVSVVFALRQALNSARADAGITEWFQMDGPVTPEDLQRFAMVDPSQFEV